MRGFDRARTGAGLRRWLAVSAVLAAGTSAYGYRAAGASIGPSSSSTLPPSSTLVVQFAPGAALPVGVSGAALQSGERPGRYILHLSPLAAASALGRLRSSAGVVYAEVARPVHATATTSPNDPCYTGCLAPDDSGAIELRAQQQYLGLIGAPAAWAVSTGAGVTVAVLDTGADASNPDLASPVPKVVRQTNVCGADPACGDTASGDDNGHGTHVTGILAANTDNGVGIASLGAGVKVDEYKVLDANGDGNTADVATAIYDAVQAGDRVISMSLANYSCAQDPRECGPDPDEGAAVEYAIAHGVVVVAAAGNGLPYQPGDDGVTYPAGYPGVLGVAATDDGGVVQSYSQWGPAANIAAPGTDIVSTWNDGGVRRETGTSMSTPEVSAAAALLIAHDPALTGAQVTQLLLQNAPPTRGGDPINGGLLDVPPALAGEGSPPRSYSGYELTASDGSVYSFGAVGAFGGTSGIRLAKPVVGIAMDPTGVGYWLAAADGGVFSLGAAAFHGSAGGLPLAKPVVGMAATPDGRGYWLVASDGGVFTYGDAGFYGSAASLRLVEPVVGMAATPDGRGYWLVAADGGIFSYGDARFLGSMGGRPLAKPVVGMASTPDGQGYWLGGADGGIFNFGDARFYGSASTVPKAGPVVGVSS